MAESDLYGLAMLWELEKGNVVTKADLLMVFVHWYLTKNNFRNVGVGDDKTLNDQIKRSELLPEGWNGGNETYALRYAMGNELYVLHGTVSNDTMIMNLLQVKTLKVSNAAFDLNTTVRAVRGDSAETLITDIDKQVLRLRHELKDPIMEGAAPSAGTQTERTEAAEVSRPRNDHFRDRPQGHVLPYAMPVPRLLGQGDLDPLGRLGGGMLMENPRNAFPNLGNLGGGLQQPRPRFDPFGPNVNRLNRPGPDNDHLPPPGYDDMFM